MGRALGRRHAVWALYLFSLRGAFGIGRGGRAKVVPFGLALLALLPALIAVGIAALAQPGRGGSAPRTPPSIRRRTSGSSRRCSSLFCAAQAPELVGRDQRYHVLPLYFSRALGAATTRWPSWRRSRRRCSSCSCVPETLLFVGRVLAPKDVVGRSWTTLPRSRRPCQRRPRGAGAGWDQPRAGGEDAATGLCHGRDHRGFAIPRSSR